MDPALSDALRAGDTARLKALMDDNPDSLAAVNAQKNNALHIAGRLGHVWPVIEISGLHPELLLAANSRGDTPLHYAARAGHEFVVGFLIGRAKSFGWTDALRVRNGFGNTALHEAVRHGRARAARELMIADRHIVAMRNNLGESPLYMAAERGSVEMVKLLLQCSLCGYFGPNGQTALHAAVCRSYEITKLILESIPEMIREVDDSESTPLHYAVSIGDQRIVKLLLEHDISTANLLDKDGLSPIHIAASMGHVDIITEIIRQCPEAIELIDKNGKNILHVAAEKKQLVAVKYVLRTPELRELINEQDNDGNTPLHLAIISHNQEIVHLFIADKRVDTSARNNKGLTPLDIASSCLDSNLRLRMHKIMVKLALRGSQFSPQRMDFITNRWRRRDDEEINRCRALANNLAIVAVLVATVTFAAAFTLPGGYKNDGGRDYGMAILTRKAAFQVFLVADTIAMLCSITVACLLICTGSLDHDIRMHSISTGMKIMCAAVVAMVTAFAMGVYVVVLSECEWLAVLICAMACSVPFLAWAITCWPAVDSFIVVRTTRNQEKEVRKSSTFKVVDLRMPTSIVVDFETPHGSKVEAYGPMVSNLVNPSQ